MPHRRILPLVILTVVPTMFVVRDVFASIVIVTARIVRPILKETHQ